MSLPVHVGAIQVLRDLRAALCLFAEDARNSLAAADMEITRMSGFLRNEARLHWDNEIRRRREEVSQAKSELFRKRTSQMFGHEGTLSEPRENLRAATQRLEHAEEKLRRVKRWEAPFQQAVMEYRSAAQPLADMIGGDLERALARLDRMIQSLEEYASGGPPRTETTRSIRAESAAAFASAARPDSPVDEPPPSPLPREGEDAASDVDEPAPERAEASPEPRPEP